MVQEVEAFGKILEFPDGMAKEDMAKHIRNNEHILNPDWKAPEGFSGVAKNVVTGAKQTGRMVGATVDAADNNLSGVEQYAKDSQISTAQNMPLEQRRLLGELSSIDRDQGAFGQIGDTLKAAGRNPMGTAQLIAEQLPNTAVSLGGGYAGFKAGAAAGSVIGPVGAAVGGTIGFLSGMFLGNVLLEAGGKAIEKASDEDGFTPQDRVSSLREGAVKGAVITGVDAATFKIGGVVANRLGKPAINAGAKAEAKVLIDAGVDVSSLAAINTALKNSPDLYKSARVAGEKAVLQSMSGKRKAAVLGSGMAAETLGEGVGEYAGEYAATGKGDAVDATIEALSSATMSVAETAYNYHKIKSGNDLSAEGIQKAASGINDLELKSGIDKISQSGSVDEAIQAANEVVSKKPVTKDDVLTTIDPNLADIERLTGLKPSESIEQAINEAQQGLDVPLSQSQGTSKNILSESDIEGQISQPLQGNLNEEENIQKTAATTKSSGVLGSNSEIVLPDGSSLPAQWQVVDADNIKASIKEGINQPRDRTRAVSDIQIQGIANNPDYRRLSDSAIMDSGAPTLTHDGLIVGGNGRFEGVSRAHEQGSSSAYHESLLNDALSKGIDSSLILGMKKPVLVRRITQPFDTRKLAIASNFGTSLQYSGLELAKIDADRMAGIEDLDITDSGDIALTGGNIQKLKQSLGDYTPTELSSLVDKSGALSQDGVKRVRNAILAKAYGNSDTLGRMVESTDTDMRNVLAALTKSAGVVAKARSEVKSGAVPKEADITDNLLDAVETFAQIRAKGQPLENYLAQQSMFGDSIDGDSQEILQFLHDNVRSQKKLTEFIKRTYDQILLIDQSTEDIFGDNIVPSKKEVIHNAKQRTDGQPEPQQQGIFIKSSEKPGGSNEQESKTQADNAGSGKEIEQSSRLNSETNKTVFDRFSALGHVTGNAVQAIYDAEQITGLKIGIPIEHVKLGKKVPARFDINRKIIEVNAEWSFTKAEGAQFLTEEILHYVDSVSKEKTISASSKLLDWDSGEIINELKNHYKDNGVYSIFLQYPIDDIENKDLSIDRRKAEIFARMGVLYFGELDKLSHVLPKTYKAYHGIFKVTSEPISGEISRKIWSFAPSIYKKVGIEYKSVGSSLSSDGSFSGDRNAAELGRLREVIGVSFRGKPSGSKADFSNASSLETNQLFSRAPEERLKDRDRAKSLERKLRDQGFNFTITAKDVRDFAAGDRGKENEAATAEKIAKIFGRRIVWIDARGDHKINGVVVPSIKDTIFLDVNSDKAAHAVMGHELSHHLEHDKPEVYKDLVRSLITFISDHNGYARKYGIEGADKSAITKEIVGDIMGDNFTKPEFWNRVAEANPTVFKQIADTIISWLKKLVTNAKMRGLGSEQWVTDAKQAQDIIAKAVAKYTTQATGFHSNKAKFHSAFHGSPHDHDKFESSKIGTGEGAQAYGYGLYFADKREVAEYYKNVMTGKTVLYYKGKKIEDQDGFFATQARNVLAYKDRDKGLRESIEDMEFRANKYPEEREEIEVAITDLRKADFDEFEERNSHLYQVELAPEQDDYLLWDKPLSEQSEKVKKVMEGVFSDLRGSASDRYMEETYGHHKNASEIYRGLAGKLGHKEASDFLHEHGVRGIKYLDGSSRDRSYVVILSTKNGEYSRNKFGSKEQAMEYAIDKQMEGFTAKVSESDDANFNYVIFHEDDVTITAKFSRSSQGSLFGNNDNLASQEELRKTNSARPGDLFSSSSTDTAQPEPKINQLSVNEPEQEELISEPVLSEQKPSGMIDDFGEKLGGARKDMEASLRREYTDADIASVPLSKIWPKEEALALKDPFMAAFAYSAREEIPTKPKLSYKVKSWVEKVKMFRGLTRLNVSGAITKDKILDFSKNYPGLENFFNKVQILEQIENRKDWGRIESVAIYPDAIRYDKDGTKIASPFASIKIDGRTTVINVTDITKVAETVKSKLGNDAPEKLMQFEIRGRAGSFFINKKGDKEYRPLKRFTDLPEARAYWKDNYDDLVAAWESVKESDNVKKTDIRSEENRPRTGQDWRKENDVTPEQFQDAFGFRGIEFGNWVSQGYDNRDRQGMLNQAFDALMDLSSIIGITPKAISLDGSLGLGFGSRGKGWASAHFEPDYLVINLTKTRGAGSLAHEWFHALDNYFQRQRGVPTGGNREDYFITYRPEPRYVHKRNGRIFMTGFQLGKRRMQNPEYYSSKDWEIDPRHPEGVRPVIERKFADLVNVLDESPMKARAEIIDKNKEDGYWSRIIERAARSFENYIIAKMMKSGYNNDYLANVKRIEEFKRDPGRYPYLLESEIAPVEEAFDNLFSEIKTKETDKGIAMFSRAEKSNMKDINPSKSIDNIDQLMNIVDKHKEVFVRWSAGPEYDMKKGAVSRDFSTGDIHKGLSAVPIKSGMSKADVAKYASEYSFSRIGNEFTRAKGVSIGAYVYTGDISGSDSDGYPSIMPNEFIGKLSDKFINNLDEGLDAELKLNEYIDDLKKRIANWTGDDIGLDIVKSKLIEKEKELRSIFDKRSKNNELPETININGVDRPTRNSEGKLIHPTEEGIRSFYKWFRDSKVVDDKGRPMAVYHGSPVDGISEFNADSFFSNKRSGARKYGKNVYPAYLSFQNPSVVDYVGQGDNDKDFDIEDAKETGNDGLIIRNADDGYSIGDQYIAFKPNQIKSAIGNRGAFSSDNDDIRFSRRIHDDELNNDDMTSDFSYPAKEANARATNYGLYNTDNMTRDDARSLIRSEAERLANILRQRGFSVKVEHSGSLAGPSSYLSVHDDDTDFSTARLLRISGHSKGVFNSQEVINVAGDEGFNRAISDLESIRDYERNKPGYRTPEQRKIDYQKQINDERSELTLKAKDAVDLIEKRDSGNKLTVKEKKIVSWYEHEKKLGRLEQRINANEVFDDPKFSFAGERSETADKYALSTAQDRLDNGGEPETVRQETGWFKSVDGKFRYEIDDSEVKWTGGYGPRNGRLDMFIKHDKLFAAYPKLAGLNTSVKFIDKKDMPGGQFFDQDGRMKIELKARDMDEAKSILLHEIQHGIQTIEGFATGGSIDQFKESNVDPDKKFRDRLNALIDTDRLSKEFGKTYKEVLESGAIDDPYALEFLSSNRTDKEFEKLVKFAKDRLLTPEQKYRRLAGEVEARNVQSRMNLSSVERKLLSPESTQDIKNFDVIVMFNGKIMENAPKPENAQKSILGADNTSSNPDTETTEGISPDRANSLDIPGESRFRKLQRLTQDSFNRFTVIKDWLADRGLNLSEQADVYAAEERYHSKVANQLEDFREKVRNPLIEKISKAGFTLSDVSDFLEAQHAAEANAAIRKLQNDPDNLAITAYGISDEEARAYLDKAPKELGKLANELRDLTEQTKHLRLGNGLLNKDITAAWEATYKHYIPVKGDAEADKGTGRGMKVNFKTKRRLGHGKRDEAVIENILMDHERAIMEVEKNRVGKHVVMMAAEIGMPELMTIGQPEKRKVLKNTTAFEVQVKGVTKAVFDSMEAARTFRQSIPLIDKKIAISDIVINPTRDQRIISSASPMLEDHEINVYIDGHAIRVQINDELMARAYTKLGIDGYGKIVAAGRMLNGYLSKVYTGYNPEFILTNIVRDFSSGTINLTGEQGIAIAAKAMENYPRSFASLLKYAATNGKSSNKWIDAYRANGGNTGAAYLSDLERLGDEVATEYASYQGVIANLKQGDMANASRAAGRKVFNATLKWIYNLNQAGENAMRLSAFRAMIDSGRSVNEAAKVAKNITVNFNRKGEFGKEANAAYLFFNASVQGVSAMSHALAKGKHKYQAWALAASMTTLGYLAAAALGGGDEDDYDKINDATKERNVLIKHGDGYLKIPVPYGYGFFWNLGRSMADAQRKDEMGVLPWHIASSAIEELTPFGDTVVGEHGEFRSDQVLLGLLPTAVKIPAQPILNKQLFSGSEVMPDSPFDQSKPDRERMWRGTQGTMYDHVAGWLETGLGIDVSPETLKYTTRTFTGGAGAFADSIVSSAMLKKESAELDPGETPFIRKAYTELTIKDHRAAYYKARDEAKTAAEELRRAKSKNDLVSFQRVLKDKKEMIALNNYANKLAEVLDAERDKQDAVRLSDDFTVAEKRLRIRELELQEQALYNQFLDVFKTNKVIINDRERKKPD